MPIPAPLSAPSRARVASTLLLTAALVAVLAAYAAAQTRPAPPQAARGTAPAEAAGPPAGRGGRGGRGGNAAPPADAVVSPDGTRAVWADSAATSVWSATRAARDGAWAQPNRLFTIRGTVHNLVYSPDGKHLAFENPRSLSGDQPYDQWGFIAVFDFADRQISFVDPTFDIDTDPVWSADSASVAFTRHVAGLADAHLTRPVTRLQLTAYTPPPLRPGETFTLASVLAAPFVMAPAPAADGKSIAFASREGKSRAVYFWRVGESARRVADFPGDDGQELTGVAVAPTGGAVAFVRGIGPNPQGDLPNPDALPDPPQQQVWIVATSDGARHLLGLGSDPVFTPDNRQVLWTSGGALMSATLEWNAGRLAAVGAPEPFFAASLRGLVLSPNGKKIAYQRGSAIEVYDLASRTSVVIPHPEASDQSPAWSPDGTRLVFRRQAVIPGQRGGGGGLFGNGNCGNYRYCGPEVSDHPWSLWTVDLATLQPRQIWQASTGVGSVYYPLDQSMSGGEPDDQFFWSADNRIAFNWESDGWRHLYSVPAAGGAPTLLTPGDGEVETAALALDRRHLVYATNIGDLGRRHIAEVGFDGAAPRPLTSGDTSQWSPAPLAGDRVAYISAGWANPPQVEIRDAAGAARPAGLPLVPATYPAARLLKPQLVSFPATDGHTAFGQLIVPAHPVGCAVIFSHGGIRRQMLPGFHYLEIYTNLYEMNQYLASRGCVVLSVEYRSSIMRGEAFRDAPGWGFAGDSEMLDFLGAAKFLVAQQHVDPARIGIYGLSWGGYMTSNALSQHSDVFKVGFDMAGVHDSSNPAGVPFSAMGHLDNWTSPVFLSQGDDDRNVTFTEGIRLARAMQAEHPQVEFQQRVLPGQPHDQTITYEQMVSLYSEGATFLLRHLGIPMP